MASVLYFFSIEVPVSYLNKVISKTGIIHIYFWQDGLLAHYPQLRVMAVFRVVNAYSVPGLCL